MKFTQGAWRLAVLTMFMAVSIGAATVDDLRRGFENPPMESRPRVWWHWLNGNVTVAGMDKDLAWMQRVGLGGVQNFDVGLGTPQIVDRRLVYMTPEWKDAFRHAVQLADSHGLEFTIAASPGWSETGGPWVAPADGMKKLVWSETLVAGGRRFTAPLSAPPSKGGPFQELPMVSGLPTFAGAPERETPAYYVDVGVFAVPATAQSAGCPLPAASAAAGNLDAIALMDGRLDTVVDLPRGSETSPAALQLSYDAPCTVRSATLYMAGAWSLFSAAEFLPILEVREAGGWRKVAEFPLAGVPTTVSFAPVTAREFRVLMGPNTRSDAFDLGPGAPGVAGGGPPGSAGGGLPGSPLKIADLRLGSEARIDRFEAKAGFSIARDYFDLSAGSDADAPATALGQVIDLSARMLPDGRLDWNAPPGQWRVLRLGYSLTGRTNDPAIPEATGLEVDKYDGAAVRRYLETYLGMYRDTVGAQLVGSKGVRALLTDSIEVGASNWTPRMIEQFRKLRGYDPRPWLPTLTGVIVESRARSDAFLYDFRRTLAELLVSEHYATIAAVAHQQGLTIYGEALESNRPSLGDDMAMRAHADIPMAALWTWNSGSGGRPSLLGDMKGAASVAHLYGRRYVAAESLTSAQAPWAFAPADLRPVIDLAFAYGINRPSIHSSVHQPLDNYAPGLTLAIFGQYFNRHETWAEMARPWIDYIARSGYLLQQGRNVADVAYFYGEEQPLTALYAQGPLQDVPVRHAWDFVNRDALLNELTVSKGELVSRGGARYRVLYLGSSSAQMTLPVLQKIAALAEAGATIVGTAPVGSPALGDDSVRYSTLVRRLWKTAPMTSVGKGRVIASRDVEAALDSIGVRPDFQAVGAAAASQFLFVHRRLEDGEIYFVNNRLNRVEKVEARFRVQGLKPEIWHADTGKSENVSWRVENGETVIPLDIAPEDSFFVVFREPTDAKGTNVVRPVLTPVLALDSDWEVTFQPGRGAPASLHMATLGSLAGSADIGVRYFSGISTYKRSFELPQGVRPGVPLHLDLGDIGDVAEVFVNGASVGTAWKVPHQLDIGAAVTAGNNALEVRVANLWVNRLIGDAQPGAMKYASTTASTYRADAPLRPSGLIGPVRLLVESNGDNR